MNAARRLILSGVPALCTLVAALALAAPASAKEVHQYAFTFGGTGSASGQFDLEGKSAPHAGIAVNDATHDVYVVDTGNDRVEEFDSSGSFLREFDGSGAPTGAFSAPSEIAVDNSTNPLDPSAGDVYVVDSGHGVIDKFTAEGSYIGQLTGTPRNSFEIGEDGVTGVAVDGNGVLWVVQGQEPVPAGPRPESLAVGVVSFSDAVNNTYISETPKTLIGGPGGIGVDFEDNIYTADRVFMKYNSSGESLWTYSFDTQAQSPVEKRLIEETFGVAVDPIEHEGYIHDSKEGTIEAYNLVGPQVETIDAGPIETFGAGHLIAKPGVANIAVDTSNGTVYVADAEANDVVVFDAFLLPSVTTAPLSEQEPTSVTLNGTVNPEGRPVTSCVFEYGLTSAYGHTVPCSPANLGEGMSPVAVSAHITGLTPGDAYHYRLVTENEVVTETGAHVSSPTPDRELIAGPVLGGEWASDVALTSATLKAQVNPNGSDTHYYFQYGPTSSYGSEAPAPAPGADIGSSSRQLTEALHLQDLAAGTTYHYRFVVVQDGETFAEPDHLFTTQSGSGELTLPDGRMWELVSPPNKHGTLIEPFEQGLTQAAADGNGITYLALEALGEGGEGNGGMPPAQILSTRASGGWRTQDVAIAHAIPGKEESPVEMLTSFGNYWLFSSNLSQAVVEPSGVVPPLSPEVSERTIYMRDNGTGSYLPLVSPENTPSGTKFGGSWSAEGGENMSYITATPDLRHVVLSSPFPLTSESSHSPRFDNLYEWNDGQLQLVDVLPNGNPLKVGDNNATATLAGEPARSISSDGRWVVWSVISNNTKGTSTEVYVRDMVGEQTYIVPGTYEMMSSDGSNLFFLKNGDLYELVPETGVETDITEVVGPGESTAGVQEEVLGASEDGSSVYFVATGVLAGGASKGADNLYVAQRREGVWSTTFIATLATGGGGPENLLTTEATGDEPDWYGLDTGFGHQNKLGLVTSRVSPNGRYLAFMSDRSLTGYDNHDAASGQPDEEVFLYDAVNGRVVCASCNPTGARPAGVLEPSNGESLVGKSQAWDKRWIAGTLPGWLAPRPFGEHSSYQPRYLSNSGRLFFDSPVALVPQDSDGFEDVYEYEPEGVGSCTEAGATFVKDAFGCVGLISSGTSSGESALLDASESGDDVFFVTTARLTPADYDTVYDVYDAHVCSSEVPCSVAPVLPPPCTSGDSCKAAPTPQPEIFGPAPSATFSGVGNVVEETRAPAPKRKAKKKAKPKKKHPKAKRRREAKRRKAKKARGTRAVKRGEG